MFFQIAIQLRMKLKKVSCALVISWKTRVFLPFLNAKKELVNHFLRLLSKKSRMNSSQGIKVVSCLLFSLLWESEKKSFSFFKIKTCSLGDKPTCIINNKCSKWWLVNEVSKIAQIRLFWNPVNQKTPCWTHMYEKSCPLLLKPNKIFFLYKF